MLGNLHVRFVVGDGVANPKVIPPGLHHTTVLSTVAKNKSLMSKGKSNIITCRLVNE